MMPIAHNSHLTALLPIIGLTLAGATPALSAPPSEQPKVATAADPYCSEKSARLMILGSYHMHNPGMDAYNVEADDVLSERRQREIAAVVEQLARYRPTKIMTETPAHDPQTAKDYGAYKEGKRPLGRWEGEQIGFRLAKRLNLTTIYSVDYPMMMSGLLYQEVDWSAGPRSVEAPKEKAPAVLSERDRLLHESTIGSYLRYLNDPAQLGREHSEVYITALMEPEEDVRIYNKSDILLNWYKRNFRIFANISRNTKAPEDNVLMIVGSGHAPILRQLAIDSGKFCLVEPNDYIKG